MTYYAIGYNYFRLRMQFVNCCFTVKHGLKNAWSCVVCVKLSGRVVRAFDLQSLAA